MTTVSLCSQCYIEVPAETFLDGGMVWIKKFCPIHGEQRGMVEVDPAFYIESLRGYRPIYPGHLVDVTDQCNLKCKYCYHANNSLAIPSFAEIIRECSVNPGPYILTGGEPTLRKDLFELIDKVNAIREESPTTRKTYVLTNGQATAEQLYLMELNKLAGIGLSCHEEGRVDFDRTIENAYTCGIKLESVFFVIDDLSQIEEIVKWVRKNPNISNCVRVKCASNVWNTENAGKLFSSQVLREFMKHGETVISNQYKTSYVPMLFEGVPMAIVSWYDVTNVDLLDINMPPTYRAKNGETCDFLKAMLINEGMRKGVR